MTTSQSQTTAIQDRIEAVGDQLRAKIGSKFQVSAFLAGFGLTILGIQLGLLWNSGDIPQYLPIVIALMLNAVFSYLAALYMLDELTMPKRFWSERWENSTHEEIIFSQAGYLTIDDIWELHNRMVFYWISLDYAGILLMIASLGLMIFPVNPMEIGPSGLSRTSLLSQTFWTTVVATTLLVAYWGLLWVIGKHYKKFKPLGRFRD